MGRYILFCCLMVSGCLQGQIPVAEESLHHTLYEDKEIRILEIIAAPGDTALMHQHDYNYCYIATAGGKMWLEDYGQKSREVNLPTHYAGGKFNLSKGPFVHRFANLDTSAIGFFAVENKYGVPSHVTPENLPDDIILESDLFTIRKIVVASLSACDLAHDGTAILLNLSDNPLLVSKDKSITYWMRFAENKPICIQNMNKEAVTIALFEIY